MTNNENNNLQNQNERRNPTALTPRRLSFYADQHPIARGAMLMHAGNFYVFLIAMPPHRAE